MNSYKYTEAENSAMQEDILFGQSTPGGEAESSEKKPVEGEVVESTEKKDPDENAVGLSSLLKLAQMGALLDEDDDEPLGGDDDDEEEKNMDSDDYHDKSVGLARDSKYRQAVVICRKGLARFPRNTVLIADIIKYSAEIGDTDTASEHYAMLKESISMARWNWRAFSFSVEFLMQEDPFANEEECRVLLKEYKKYLPFEENAFVAEYQLEEALGNHERSMAVLEEAIATLENAYHSALLLARLQMKRGLYEKVKKTARYGIAAAVAEEDDSKVHCLHYFSVLAEDHLLWKRVCRDEPVTPEEVEALHEKYDRLVVVYGIKMIPFSAKLRGRRNLLELLKADLE